MFRDNYKRIKIKKTLNRYIFENTDFRLTSKGSLEAWNCALQNVFRFISIRLPVPEISSCKEKVIFNRLL